MNDTSFLECFLLVPDLPTARCFYEEALGLQVADATDDSVTYDVAGTTLKLQADYPDAVFESFNLERPPAENRGHGAVVVLDLAEDVTDVSERVADSAGAALFEPRDVAWLETPMFLAEDPHGYTLELR